MLKTPEEQAELEPSAQSSAVRPQHKDSGTDDANIQYLTILPFIMEHLNFSRCALYCRDDVWLWTPLKPPHPSQYYLVVRIGLYDD